MACGLGFVGLVSGRGPRLHGPRNDKVYCQGAYEGTEPLEHGNKGLVCVLA